MVFTAVGLVIFLVTSFLSVAKAWCRNTIRIICFLVGAFVSIGLSMAFAREAQDIVAGITLYFTMLYLLVIHEMVFMYCKLVSRHLTQKEF